MIRTTNGAEAFHRVFNTEFFISHPNLPSIVRKLNEMDSEVTLKMRFAKDLKRPYIKNEDPNNELFIAESIHLYRIEKTIDLFRFLKRLGFRFAPENLY